MIQDSDKYISLRTFRKSGIGVDTPVWFALHNEGSLYCYSAGNVGKVKRLRNSNKAEVALCDYRGKLNGSWQSVQATLIDETKEKQLAFQLLRGKYGFQFRLLDLAAWLGGRIRSRQVIKITLNDIEETP